MKVYNIENVAGIVFIRDENKFRYLFNNEEVDSIKRKDDYLIVDKKIDGTPTQIMIPLSQCVIMKWEQ